MSTDRKNIDITQQFSRAKSANTTKQSQKSPVKFDSSSMDNDGMRSNSNKTITKTRRVLKKKKKKKKKMQVDEEEELNVMMDDIKYRRQSTPYLDKSNN